MEINHFPPYATKVAWMVFLLTWMTQPGNTIDVTYEVLIKDGHKTTVEKESILLVGRVGTGKSTLSKFLRRDRSLAIENKWGRYQFSDGDRRIGRNGLRSKTILPNVEVDSDTGVTVVDFAGFENFHSPEVDVMIGHLNQGVLNAARTLKVVLVEDFDNFDHPAPCQSFISALQRVVRILGDNLAALDGSVGLIATKAEGESIQSLKSVVERHVQQTIEYLLVEHAWSRGRQQIEVSRQIEMLKRLVQTQNFAIFHKPSEIGDPWQEGSLQVQDYKSIRSLIFQRLRSLTPFAHSFPPVVSEDTLNFIESSGAVASSLASMDLRFEQLLEHLRDNLKSTLGTTIRPLATRAKAVAEYCEDYEMALRAALTFEQAEGVWHRKGVKRELLSELRLHRAKTEFLHEVTTRDASEVKTRFSNSFVDLGHSFIMDLTRTHRLHHFMEKVALEGNTYKGHIILMQLKRVLIRSPAPHDSMHEAEGSSQLVHILDHLNDHERITLGEFLDEQTGMTIINDDGHVFIQACFLALSEVKEKIADIRADYAIKEIATVATNKLFVDCDWEVLDAHLRIATPTLEVVGPETRLIRMVGESGKAYTHPAPPGNATSNGTDGAPGRPSFAPGNFNLLALRVINPYLLKIESKGGNGGPGQHGGRGNRPAELWFRELPSNKFMDTPADAVIKKCGDNLFQQARTGAIVSHITGPVTSGGNGGAGSLGSLAAAITLQVQEEQSIQTNFIIGLPGKPGDGGLSRPMQDCTLVATYRTESGDIERSIGLPGPAVPYQPHDGVSGQWMSGNLNRSKYEESFFSDYRLIVMAGRYLMNNACDDDGIEAQDLLAYVLRSFNIKDYVLLLEFMEQENGLSPKEAEGLHRTCTFISESFRIFKRECGDGCQQCQLSGIEGWLLGLMDSLHSSAQGKQIVNLNSRVNSMLNVLSEAHDTATRLQIHQTVLKENSNRLKEIYEAGNNVNETFNSHMQEISDDVEKNVQDLIDLAKKMEQGYKNSTEELQHFKDKLKRNLIARAAIGFVKVLGTVGGLIYKPIGVITNVVTGIADVVVGHPAIDLGAHKVVVPGGLGNAEKAIEDFNEQQKNDLSARQKGFNDALQELLEADVKENGTILDSTSRAEIQKMMTNNGNSSVTTGLLSGVADKLKYLKAVPGYADKIKGILDDALAGIGHSSPWLSEKIDGLKKKVELAGKVAVVGGVVADVLSDLSQGSAMIDNVQQLIRDNYAAMSEMMQYEQRIVANFLPMLENMLATFRSMQGELSSDSSVLLQLRKFDIKRNVRNMVGLVEKFTEGFGDATAGLQKSLAELQDLMTFVVDAYDKISDLQHLMQLTNYIGRLSDGGNDPLSAECAEMLGASASVQSDELLRELYPVFTAYQQILFPYGGMHVSILNDTLNAFRTHPNASFEDKLALMTPQLKALQKHLEFRRDVIVNGEDADTLQREFSSRYRSTSPFYVWRGRRHPDAVRSLLLGESVTLVASVQADAVENAVKFNAIGLNISSSNAEIASRLQSQLLDYDIQMTHRGPSNYRCGPDYFSIIGDEMQMQLSFERDARGNPVGHNAVYKKLLTGDVVLSPYTVWRLQIVDRDGIPRSLPGNFTEYIDDIDLELTGYGFYLKAQAAVCGQGLDKYYKMYQASVLL